LFVSGDTLMAQPFEPRSQRMNRPAFAVTESVMSSTNGDAQFSASENGVLTTVSSVALTSQLSRFDRAGKLVESVGSRQRQYNYLQFVRDGSRVLFQRQESGAPSIWMLDPISHSENRLTSGDNAVVSPDGQSIVFEPGGANRTRGMGIVRMSLTNPGPPEQLWDDHRLGWPNDWSHDGRWLLFMHPEPATGMDLSILDVTGVRTVKPLVQATANEAQGRFSPDGRWVAYQSDESGRFEIYIWHFPDGRQKTLVSN